MTAKRLFIFGVLVTACMSVAASAAPLAVNSYSMDNGGTGTYVYQDGTYSNCVANSCNTTGAPLMGGTGRLTNGVVPTADWNVGSNSSGWIGWDSGELNGSNPTIDFFFPGSSTINSVSIWYDNSLGAGGVTEPASVSIDGTNYAFTPNSTEGPQLFTISGLNLTGSSATVQFFQGTDVWIMIGQVTFNGAVSTAPEPGTTVLMGGGLFAAAFMLWRKRPRAR